MNSAQEERFNTLMRLSSKEELFVELTKLARELGFEYVAYGLRMPFPVSQPKVELLNNYPDEWQAKYATDNLIAVDPTVAHGAKSILPVVWSEDLFVDTQEFWEEARGAGLRFGWAQSSRDPKGVAGMLTLARSADQLSGFELQHKTEGMLWLTQVAHVCMSNLLTAELVPESEAVLTEREVTILRWTADGKTSSDIGFILKISERTINFHINNSMRKLNASNKTAAVVRAAMLGMLS